MKTENIKKVKASGEIFCEEVASKIPDLKKNRDVVDLAAGIALAISQAKKKETNT